MAMSSGLCDAAIAAQVGLAVHAALRVAICGVDNCA